MITWLDGEIVEKKQWCTDLYSIKIKTRPLDFIAGQFVIIGLDKEDTRIHRPYSLVNPPADSLLEVHFNTVKEGDFSPLLAQASVGDPIYISHRPSGLLTLAETPDVANLWFFATGTGIGPFLSILQTEEPWQRFEKITVCYSVKTAAEMAYRQDFEQLAQQYPDQFCFVPFITREKTTDAIHSRVTKYLKSGKLEKHVNLPLLPDNSHVMLCGNSKMLDEATQILEKKGLQRHTKAKPGQISIEKYF